MVTSGNRLIFTLLCTLICVGFYKFDYKFPWLAHNPLILLGEASYSVYLLHPLVYSVIDIVNNKYIHLNSFYVIFISIVLTLILSYISYNYFELYFIRLNKKKKRNSITINFTTSSTSRGLFCGRFVCACRIFLLADSKV